MHKVKVFDPNMCKIRDQARFSSPLFA